MEKNKKFTVSQDQKSWNSLFKRNKNIYDIIRSEELDLLYKKNAHLLARLSKTGKENTQLYNQVFSLNKEKSSLGDKNTILQNKYLSLKEQISLFARQHRKFSEQSYHLQQELERAKSLSVKENKARLNDQIALKKQEKKIKLLEKKEQVYRNQIRKLQELHKEKEAESKTKLRMLQNEYEENRKTLEEKNQQIYAVLQQERKDVQTPYKINNKLKTINLSLNKQYNHLKATLETKDKSYQEVLKEKSNVASEYNKLRLALDKIKKDKIPNLKYLQKLEQDNQNLKQGLAREKSLRQKQIVIFKKSRTTLEKEKQALQNNRETLKKSYETEIEKLEAVLKDKVQKRNQVVKCVRDLEKKNHNLKQDLSKEKSLRQEQAADLQKNHEIQVKKLKTLLKGKETTKPVRALAKENHNLKQDLSKEKNLREEQTVKLQKLNTILQKERMIFQKSETDLQRNHEMQVKKLKALLKDKESLKAEVLKQLRILEEEREKQKQTREDLIINYKNKMEDQEEQSLTIARENDSLKRQRENLQKALLTGKLGFDQAMFDFRKRYKELYKSQADQQQRLKEQTEYIQNLKKNISHLKKQETLQHRQEIENQQYKDQKKQIAELYGELQATKEHNQDLARQIQNFKSKQTKIFLKERKQMQEEIKKIKWSKDKNLLHIKENSKKELDDLKQGYEKRIQNLETAFKKKLQHIRIEMENDLCSEKKRYEVFKSMKARQFQEMQDNLALWQKENQELQTKTFVLEKSLEESRGNLHKQLKNNKHLEDQNDSVKALWQDLQKQIETKERQVQSLQKLNRSLSLLLNKRKGIEDKPSVTAIFREDKKSTFINPQKPLNDQNLSKETKPFTQVLADLHFD